VIFTYWTNPVVDRPPSTAAWRERFAGYTVFGDSDVIPLLTSDTNRRIYERITLPACKSDVARLVLLHQYGGLYVDAHTGPSNGDRLAETLEVLSSFELILFCKLYVDQAAPGRNLMNSILAARRGSAALHHLIDLAFANLIRHSHKEAETTEHVPYHLWSLTGTGLLLESFFDTSTNPFAIEAAFRDKVFLHEMTSPASPGFHLYQYYAYRQPGQHWSERQQHQRLFAEQPR
jgi:hypothetical protein